MLLEPPSVEPWTGMKARRLVAWWPEPLEPSSRVLPCPTMGGGMVPPLTGTPGRRHSKSSVGVEPPGRPTHDDHVADDGEDPARLHRHHLHHGSHRGDFAVRSTASRGWCCCWTGHRSDELGRRSWRQVEEQAAPKQHTASEALYLDLSLSFSTNSPSLLWWTTPDLLLVEHW